MSLATKLKKSREENGHSRHKMVENIYYGAIILTILGLGFLFILQTQANDRLKTVNEQLKTAAEEHQQASDAQKNENEQVHNEIIQYLRCISLLGEAQRSNPLALDKCAQSAAQSIGRGTSPRPSSGPATAPQVNPQNNPVPNQPSQQAPPKNQGLVSDNIPLLGIL